MSLDALIDEATNNKAENSISNDNRPSSIADFSRIKYSKEKLHNPNLCPNCGSDDTEPTGYSNTERRCNNCEVLTYFTTDYDIKLGEMI